MESGDLMKNDKVESEAAKEEVRAEHAENCTCGLDGEENVVRDEERAAYNAGSKAEQEEEEEGEGVPDLNTLLLELKNQNEREKAVGAEYLRRLQLLQADYDNFRKRTQKEKEDLAKYASEKIVTDILPVLDNLERGLAASQKAQDFESLVKGVEMILRQLTIVLEREGLKHIDAVGSEFDPTRHEAVMRVDAEGVSPNTVVDEVQKGYYLKDKVLRPSMVRVSQ